MGFMRSRETGSFVYGNDQGKYAACHGFCIGSLKGGNYEQEKEQKTYCKSKRT